VKPRAMQSAETGRRGEGDMTGRWVEGKGLKGSVTCRKTRERKKWWTGVGKVQKKGSECPHLAPEEQENGGGDQTV